MQMNQQGLMTPQQNAHRLQLQTIAMMGAHRKPEVLCILIGTGYVGVSWSVCRVHNYAFHLQTPQFREMAAVCIRALTKAVATALLEGCGLYYGDQCHIDRFVADNHANRYCDMIIGGGPLPVANCDIALMHMLFNNDNESILRPYLLRYQSEHGYNKMPELAKTIRDLYRRFLPQLHAKSVLSQQEPPRDVLHFMDPESICFVIQDKRPPLPPFSLDLNADA